jgi:release factor glutamine methyltransferase
VTGLTLSLAQNAVNDAPPLEAMAALRPSEYTAALIHALRTRPSLAYRAAALEIGSGSGVVLAAIGELGAASLCGVDIENSAVAAGAVLLHAAGHGDKAEMARGDMWRPVAGRRFDLIVSNLPQFPMEPLGYGGRLPSWSAGGPDGRWLVDRFLVGLADHLSPGGCAVMTHNAFIDIERSRLIVQEHGLSLRVATSMLIYLPPEKLTLMSGNILLAEQGRSIHRYGPHAFGEMCIVEISARSRG